MVYRYTQFDIMVSYSAHAIRVRLQLQPVSLLLAPDNMWATQQV
jgi:hypothetical protein